MGNFGQYGTTVLLLFILFSCVYKKHVRDWWWFKFGAASFVVGVAFAALAQIVPVFVPGTGPFTSGNPAYVVVDLLADLAIIGALAGMIMACIKHAEDESEYLRCLKCGHILKGLTEPRCPECGRQI